MVAGRRCPTGATAGKNPPTLGVWVSQDPFSAFDMDMRIISFRIRIRGECEGGEGGRVSVFFFFEGYHPTRDPFGRSKNRCKNGAKEMTKTVSKRDPKSEPKSSRWAPKAIPKRGSKIRCKNGTQKVTKTVSKRDPKSELKSSQWVP